MSPARMQHRFHLLLWACAVAALSRPLPAQEDPRDRELGEPERAAEHLIGIVRELDRRPEMQVGEAQE